MPPLPTARKAFRAAAQEAGIFVRKGDGRRAAVNAGHSRLTNRERLRDGGWHR